MRRKPPLFLFTMILLCAGCGGTAENVTVMPEFVTATLPPTLVPQATQIPTLPAPLSVDTEEASPPAIEGMTTTQVNVRSAPSTASASFGLIGIFVKVQVIGRDASGSWYQIVYEESETGWGWVRAEYVQVDAGAGIRLVETAPIPGAAVSGIITQKVNVRSGPGVEFNLLGVLNPNDLVFITGRDTSGKWVQIEFAGAPDGRGWVTAELMQADGLESAPRIGEVVEETSAPTVEIPTMVASAKTASQDGDSMQSPLAVTVLSAAGSRALQVQGNVSAPDGDTEDWVQFTTRGGAVSIQITCPDTLRAELWNNGRTVGNFSCGETTPVKVAPDSAYFLQLIQNGTGYTEYVLHLEVIH